MRDFINTKELSELIGINEKKIYSLANEGKIPGSMITGKWLFSREKITKHLNDLCDKNLNKIQTNTDDLNITISGSDDPATNTICSLYNDHINDSYAYISPTGSFNGLRLLLEKKVDISLAHIYDESSEMYNLKPVDDILGKGNSVLVNLFKRNIGFVFRKIEDFKDVITKNPRFVFRKTGTAVRSFTTRYLSEYGIQVGDNSIEVDTHMEVGYSILSADYDLGIASEGVARLIGLGFHKLRIEQFDMVFLKEMIEFSRIKKILNLVSSDSFIMKVNKNFGYQTELSGTIIY